MFGLVPTMVSQKSVIHALKPRLWFDARMTAGADGTALASWTEMMGTGLAAAQAVVALQPLVKRGVSGVGDVVRFDGSNDAMQTASLDLSATAAVTVIACGDISNGAGNGMVAELSDNYGNHAGCFAMFMSGGASKTLLGAVHGNNSTTYKVTTTNQGGKGTVALVADFAQLGSVSEVTIYHNGSLLAVSSIFGTENTGNFGNFVLNIGSRNQVTWPFTGDIAHLLIFDRALTGAQVAAVDRALRDLCGIA